MWFIVAVIIYSIPTQTTEIKTTFSGGVTLEQCVFRSQVLRYDLTNDTEMTMYGVLPKSITVTCEQKV